MKTKRTRKSVLLVLVMALSVLSLQMEASCSFSYSYPNSSGWSMNGSNYSIGSGTFSFVATPCSTYNWAAYPLACTLSDDNWCADIDFVYTSRSNYGVAHTLMAFTSNNTSNSWNIPPSYGVSTNNDIEVYINCPANGAAGTEKLYANSKYNATWGTATSGITVNAGNTYYLRLQRLSPTSGMLSVFSNSARTTLITSQCFTINASVTGLAYLQQGCIPQGSQYRQLTGTLSNLVVSDVNPGISGLSAGSNCSGTTASSICVASPCGANGYTWSVPAGSTINSGQGTSCINVTWGSISGSVTCTTSFIGGACSLTQSAPVTNYQSPTANAGPDIMLCCGTIWYIGNGTGTASGGTAPYTFSWNSISPGAPGTYNGLLSCTNCANPQLASCTNWTPGTTYVFELTVTDANGCTSTDQVNVLRPTTACRVANPANNAAVDGPFYFAIAPNPNDGSFLVMFENYDLPHGIEVLDVLGRVVYSQASVSGTAVPVDLSAQPKGIYFVRCRENGQELVQRVIVH